MTTYIGVSGPIGAGKTTFAELLAAELGGDTWLDSFASPIRYIVEDLGFSLQRDVKEVPKRRTYPDFNERLQQRIEERLGYLEDNDKALLYALVIEELEALGALTRYESGDDLCTSPRGLCLVLGRAGRGVRGSFWIDALRARHSGASVVVLHDVRMPNEAAICDEVFKVVRPGKHYNQACRVESVAAALPFSDVILNYGDLQNLKSAAAAVSKRFKEDV